MSDEKYLAGIDPVDSRTKSSRSKIMFLDKFGNLVDLRGVSYINSEGLKDFAEAIKLLATNSNIKTIDPQDNER